MNYLKIYNDLIVDAIKNPKPDAYKEKHHIIPKCLGGTDDESNLVMLTARQHFLAHWLLFKIYGGSKLAHAWYAMCRIGKGQELRRVNSRYFKYAKESRNKILSENSKGKLNNFYGKKHSIETKKRLSEAHKGKIYKTEKQIEEWVENVAKKRKSEEHKKKIGRTGLIMLMNKNTQKVVRIPKEDKHLYDTTIWKNPNKIKKQPTTKCEHCGKVCINGNYKRWHGINCKEKPNEN